MPRGNGCLLGGLAFLVLAAGSLVAFLIWKSRVNAGKTGMAPWREMPHVPPDVLAAMDALPSDALAEVASAVLHVGAPDVAGILERLSPTTAFCLEHGGFLAGQWGDVTATLSVMSTAVQDQIVLVGGELLEMLQQAADTLGTTASDVLAQASDPSQWEALLVHAELISTNAVMLIQQLLSNVSEMWS